jgi:hypothetical protein
MVRRYVRDGDHYGICGTFLLVSPNLPTNFSLIHGLPVKPHIQGLGDKKVVKDELGERTEVVGAWGWGGGVRLARSDQDTQDMNRVNLDRFLRKQRRLKEKREREAAQMKETAE